MIAGFEKYEQMKCSGKSPHQIYLTAKADNMDAITLLRLLRAVCGLSLGDAKKVSGALDVWTQRQDVKPGAIVYWEGSSSDEGFYLMQGRVIDVYDGVVSVGERRKFLLTKDSLEEVPVPAEQATPINAKYFEKTLAERFAEAFDFWNDLAQIHSKAV